MFIRLTLTGILSAALLLPACHQADSATGGASGLRPAPYPTVWYDSLSRALDTYVALGKALHREDTVLANTAARMLQGQLDRLPENALGTNEDSVELVETTLGSMHAELDGFLGETNLAGKRDEYHMVTDIWYDLFLLTGLKGSILYRVHDATARDSRGGNWLLTSNPATADDPYSAQAGQHTATDTLRFQ